MRFKTEAEFVAEFNVGWRNMYPAWIPEMDNLFGATLEPEDEYKMRQLLIRLNDITLDDTIELVTDWMAAFNCSIADFLIGAWMVKEDSLDTDSVRESLERLYSTYGYDEVALIVLLKAREKDHSKMIAPAIGPVLNTVP